MGAVGQGGHSTKESQRGWRGAQGEVEALLHPALVD